MKKCGLVIRVSTDRQAMNEEGSLKNQLQRLRGHIDYKKGVCGEEWEEARRYVLEGVSGKDSVRSPQFAQLFQDIRTGKVNTVLCTALDRVSRSVRDFLSFFEILQEHNVEFVCLKQNYDTTTPEGRMFVTMMMVLAQFEREQTAARTREAAAARAERGLWNGAVLYGYDSDPNRRGSLAINEAEAEGVRFMFTHYLECGSVAETAEEMNRLGYRTKRFQSRRGGYHGANPFGYSTLQNMLRNLSYIGKKEIKKDNKRKDPSSLPSSEVYRVVDAVWTGIVDEETFWEVQRLLDANTRSNRNGTKPSKHTYLLSGGMLYCGECGAAMEARCGTGRKRVRYYYYACKNKDCRLKIPCADIERVILKRIGELADREDIIADLVAETNKRLEDELAALARSKRRHEREMKGIRAEADAVMVEWGSDHGEGARVFVRDRLNELAERRQQTETAIEEADLAIAQLEDSRIEAEVVRRTLRQVTEVFASLQPYQRKELARLLLHRAEVRKDGLRLAFYGQPPDVKEYLNNKVAQSLRINSEPPKTLPRVDSNHQPFG